MVTITPLQLLWRDPYTYFLEINYRYLIMTILGGYLLLAVGTTILLTITGYMCDNSVSGYDILDAGFILPFQEAAAIEQCIPHTIIAIITVMLGSVVCLVTIGILSDKLATFTVAREGTRMFTDPVRWIQFSTIATLHRGPDGYPQLSVRMVNGRGTQLIKPKCTLSYVKSPMNATPDGTYRHHAP